MAISSGVIVIFTPAAAWARVAHMTVMPQLFVTVAELSSEASWSIVSMHLGGYAVLYRPGIDGEGAEIPDARHIGALATPVTAVPVKDISGAKSVSYTHLTLPTTPYV